MTKWNIDTIADDLKTIVGVIKINYDKNTPNLSIQLGGCEDWLFVCGFDSKDDGIIDSVEIWDSHGHGLNSHDFRLARLYIEVRQYFINRNFNFVQRMEDVYEK